MAAIQSASPCFAPNAEESGAHAAVLVLKIVAIVSILVAGTIGITIPILGKSRNILRPDSTTLMAIKAFAAGVILATGFVHMLPSGSESLSDPCLTLSKFPFSGFFAMLAGLLTLLFDFLAKHYYERKHNLHANYQSKSSKDASNGAIGFEETEGGRVYVVPAAGPPEMHNDPVDHHSHVHFVGGESNDTVRQVVVSQILELGIVSHSVIIGLSLGVSRSASSIRPLIAALSFHQFFEGFALGGSISQAQFKTTSAVVMACFFAVTTPVGIAVGIAVAAGYNENSAAALISEGILDSMSAGILIYMSLVDLIAEQFLHSKSKARFRQQLMFFCMLILGAGMMASLAVWA